MGCELKFIELPKVLPPTGALYGGHAQRVATCTHPDHTWAVIAPGTGTAKAKVEHGKHLRAVEGGEAA